MHCSLCEEHWWFKESGTGKCVHSWVLFTFKMSVLFPVFVWNLPPLVRLPFILEYEIGSHSVRIWLPRISCQGQGLLSSTTGPSGSVALPGKQGIFGMRSLVSASMLPPGYMEGQLWVLQIRIGKSVALVACLCNRLAGYVEDSFLSCSYIVNGKAYSKCFTNLLKPDKQTKLLNRKVNFLVLCVVSNHI